MATRRMISLDVVDTDMFLDLPGSSQLLYMHLLLRADDDGFVASLKRIMRTTGASTDDIKLLLGKKYLIPFESGVCVIRHWRIHNYIRSDRYKKTIYQEEKAQLENKPGEPYTLELEGETEKITVGIPDGIPNGYPGKVRLGKDKEYIYLKILKRWNEKKPLPSHSDKFMQSHFKKKHEDEIKLYGEDVVLSAIDNYASVLASEDHWFTHRWTLPDFIARGLSKFTDDITPLDNFLKKKIADVKDEGKLRPTPENNLLLECPSCGSPEIIGTLDTAKCRSCGLLFELVDKNWVPVE